MFECEDEERKIAHLVNVSYCLKEFHDESDDESTTNKQLIVYAVDSDEAKNKVQEYFDSKLTNNQYYTDFGIEVCETLY